MKKLIQRAKNTITNNNGNEALGFLIVALITVIVGVVVLTLFRTNISSIATGMMDKIRELFAISA